MSDIVAAGMPDKPPLPNIDLCDRIAEALREFLRCDNNGYRDGGREWININNMTDAVITELRDWLDATSQATDGQ